MSGIADRAVRTLDLHGIPLLDGLSESQVDRIETELGVSFAPDHRAFLRRAVPVGFGFPDWNDLDLIRGWISDTIDGIVADVMTSGFWAPTWGPRPMDSDERAGVSRQRLASVPTLLPVYSHRGMAAGAPEGGPVFSVHQTDVIFYGRDLAHYWVHELDGRGDPRAPDVWVDFWSDLATPSPGYLP